MTTPLQRSMELMAENSRLAAQVKMLREAIQFYLGHDNGYDDVNRAHARAALAATSPERP